jgi:tetratricopeptide (TPR) repeat protein
VEESMMQDRRVIGYVLGSLCVLSLVACELQSSSEVEEKKSLEEKTAQRSMSTEGVAPVTEIGLLVAPATSLGRSVNDEGVQHGQQGHWDAAEKAFRKAIETDDKLAEAQYNLGLVLDRQGKHEEALKSFNKAVELAPTNKLITESDIMKKHKST